MNYVEINDWSFLYKNTNYKASVPGDISVDLYTNKLIPDPLYSDNYSRLGWVHNRDWEYCSIFNISDEMLKSDVLKIVFYGIDTYSTIYINDSVIGTTSNMFKPYYFDIKNKVVLGLNKLKVVIHSIRNEFKKYTGDYHPGTFNNERCQLRKVQCHFGWDWAMDYPGTGIYKKVELMYGTGYFIKNVQVNTNNNGMINFMVELPFNNRRKDTNYIDTILSIKVMNGDETYTTKKEVVGSINSLCVKIDNPKLWYANGYGNQPLYEYQVELLDSNLNQLDKTSGKFGIREAEIKEELREDGGFSFDFYINGERNRFIGGNWVPASPFTGAIQYDEYRKFLKQAKEAGINMLRIWGGGLYEPDSFYDLADEYGITIWQDFMLSCEVVPDDLDQFNKEFVDEATYQIKRLRNHPSLLLWCGGNELSNSFKINDEPYGLYLIKTILPGLVSELDSKRRYLWNSPYSKSELGNDPSSGDCHKNVQAISIGKDNVVNFRDYMPIMFNNFDSECGMLGLCRLRSFKKFIPEDKLWPISDIWRERLMCNPFDWCTLDFTDRITKLVDDLMGHYNSIEDLFKKSQIVHAEILGGEIDYYRAHKENSGLLSWMYNDYAGNGTWSIVDDCQEAKPALYAMKRAGKRLKTNIIKDRDGYYINVINDKREDFNGSLVIKHQNIDGTTYESIKEDITVNAFTQISIKYTFNNNLKQSYLYSELRDNSNIVVDYSVFFYDLWVDKEFKKNINFDVCISKDKKTADIKIKANEFARCIFIDLPDGHEVYCSDNYFDMIKGQERTITISSDKDLNINDIKILTFNDVWKE